MRTKTILLTAALVAAGVASSMAQSNVYSLNVVGYVNTVIPASGFTMVNTPLDSGNNVASNLFPTVANGTIIYSFTASSGFSPDVYDNGWSVPNFSLQPGSAYFYFNPTASAVTNTFVGTVLQGTNTNSLANGFSLVGSIFPTSGTVDTNLGMPTVNGTIVYTFLSSAVGYTSYVYDNGWVPSSPVISVGQGFFVFQPAATNWVQGFTVQ